MLDKSTTTTHAHSSKGQAMENEISPLVLNDAAELRGMLAAREWRKGMLIARSVVKGKRAPEAGKVSPPKFASMVDFFGWSAVAVNRHLDAWERAAEAGHVPHSRDMVPGQEVELPHEDLWFEFYPVGGSDVHAANEDRRRAFASAAEDAGTTVTTVARFASSPQGVAGAILADPRVAQAAQDALSMRVSRKYPNATFMPEDHDDIQLTGLMDAKNELEKAVKSAQKALRLMRDMPITQNVKDTVKGTIGRLETATDELQMFVRDDPEFEAGVPRMTTGRTE